ncbi:MAG: hypothetical protein ACRESW_06950 [Nevskiales bacterium]
MMLAIGLVAGWWIARHGLPMLKTLRAPTTQATGDIRRVDFRNFKYPALCAEETDLPGGIPVRQGEYIREDEDGRFSFGVFSVSYGDLTGDGQPEAVIAASCNTGGTGQFSEGMVFSMRENTPVLIGRVHGGDRAYGGIAGLSVNSGRLLVERYATDEDGPACCPKYIETTRLRWDGAKLVQEGDVSRRAAPVE